MEEIITKYILKSFNESLNDWSIIQKNNMLFVDDSYVLDLEKIFGVDKSVLEVLIPNLMKDKKLMFFTPKTIVETLGDFEEETENIEEFNLMIIEIIYLIRDIKIEAACTQRYEKAAIYRDLERDLTKIYKPSEIKKDKKM